MVADDPRDLDRGGDPPCWAHLFDEDGEPSVPDADLAHLVRDLADAVVICDPEGAIVLWNEAASRVFGWGREEALGASLDLIIPERLRERHWQGYRTVMETGQTSYADRLLEVPALRRDGSTISIAFTVSLLRHDDGTPKAIAAVIRDDTERWQERRTLRRELDELRAERAGAGEPGDREPAP
jgi:PAS domain S-box-containing protein